MAKKKPSTKKTPPTFEEALESLKQCLQALESDELTLDQSLSQYESGVSHLKHCHRAIAAAKQRIEKLVRIDADGNAILETFDNTASEKTTSGTRRGSKSSEPNQRSSAKSKATSKATSKTAAQRSSPDDSDRGDDDRDGDGDMDDSTVLF